MKEYDGISFLDKLYSDLYMSDEVQHTRKNTDKRLDTINRYFDRLERVHLKADTDSKKRLLKHFYYKRYVVKEEDLPNNIDKKNVIEEQKKRIDMWIEYLSSSEVMFYPTWAKYWAFQGMLKLGAYDPYKESYQKRDRNTVNPFIEPNPEIIGKCIETIMKLVKGDKIDQEVEERLVKTDSFKKIYTIFEKEYKKNVVNKSDSDDGIWIKYDKSEESISKMLKSLDNKNSGWCIAGEGHARGYSEHGDFYIYYTKDKDGNYTMPRIVILTHGRYGINQIRGIEPGENLEECMLGPLEKQLKSMDFLDDYAVNRNLQKVTDLKKLKDIGIKTEKGIDLTEEEIRCLYTTDFGFGTIRDPRFEKVIKNRNPINDFNSVTDRKLKLSMIDRGFIPDSSVSDRDLMIDAIKISRFNYKYGDETIRDDKEVLLIALERDSFYGSVEYAGPNLKKDKTLMMELVSKNACCYQYLDSILRDDEDVTYAALTSESNDTMAFSYASERLRRDPNFVKKAVKANSFTLKFIHEDLLNNEKFIYDMIIEGYPSIIEYASPEIKKKKYLGIMVVERVGWLIKYLDPTLQDDEEVVRIALSNNGNSFDDISPRLQQRTDLFKLALKTLNNEYVFRNVNKDFFKETDILLKSLDISGDVYRYAKEEDKHNPDIALKAVSKDGRAFKHVPAELKDNEEFMLDTFKLGRRYFFSDLSKRLKNDLSFLLKLVNIDGMYLGNIAGIYENDVAESIKNNEELILTAINQNSDAQQFIPLPLKLNPDFMEKVDLLLKTKEENKTMK